ncbi:MAG: type II toxin-antitoxin system VapC family toxin [Actinobacteria bacterium]|nr:type II toxin-antitoxin system VapC family toxin [Actinomycetota bacterium]
MTLFLDTSALVKRYVAEMETDRVLTLMESEPEWCAPALCYSETRVTLCHLGFEDETLSALADALESDWDRFFVVPIDDLCLAQAIEIGCRHRVRTLDAIHLAAASRLPGPTTFATFDSRQAQAARALELEVARL